MTLTSACSRPATWTNTKGVSISKKVKVKFGQKVVHEVKEDEGEEELEVSHLGCAAVCCKLMGFGEQTVLPLLSNCMQLSLLVDALVVAVR